MTQAGAKYGTSQGKSPTTKETLWGPNCAFNSDNRPICVDDFAPHGISRSLVVNATCI
jgi:hypothetical protein